MPVRHEGTYTPEDVIPPMNVNAQKITDLMARCIECGLCSDACPSHAHGGCDPFLVMTGKEGGKVRDCIGCGACTEVCPTTDPKQVMMYRKSEALGLEVPGVFLRTGYVMPPADPSWRDGLPGIPSGEDIFLMPGCTTVCKVPFLQYATERALDAVGVHGSALPKNTCCMYPLSLRSLTDAQRDVYKHRMENSGVGRPIVTICAGCTNELARSGVQTTHLSVFLADYLDRIKELPGTDLKVALQPGCSGKIFAKEFEAVVRATGARPIGNPFGCCGKTIPRIADELMAERQAEAAEADAIVVGCPMCFRMYDSRPHSKPVLYLGELVALAAGDRETQRFHLNRLEV